MWWEDRELGPRCSKIEMGLSLWKKAMNDLLPSDQSEIVPAEMHWSAFVSLSVYILCKAEFASMWGSHFGKEMPFFCSPLGNWGQFSANICWAPVLCRSCARYTKISDAWSLPSGAESH